MNDNQIVFNQVKLHLLTQKAWSLDHNDMPRYRGRNGRKCGIGSLIPDRLYTPAMEKKLASKVKRLWPEAIPYRVSDKFLDEFQEIHDEYEPHEWWWMLDRFAKKWGLTER